MNAQIGIDAPTPPLAYGEQSLFGDSAEDGNRFPVIGHVADGDGVEDADLPEMVEGAPIHRPELDSAFAEPVHEAIGTHWSNLSMWRQERFADEHLGESLVDDHQARPPGVALTRSLPIWGRR